MSRRRYPRVLRERYEMNAELRLLRAANSVARSNYRQALSAYHASISAVLDRICASTSTGLGEGAP